MQRIKNVFLGVGVLAFGFCVLFSMLCISSAVYAEPVPIANDPCVAGVRNALKNNTAITVDPMTCPILGEVIDTVPSGSIINLVPFNDGTNYINKWSGDVVITKSLTLIGAVNNGDFQTQISGTVFTDKISTVSQPIHVTLKYINIIALGSSSDGIDASHDSYFELDSTRVAGGNIGIFSKGSSQVLVDNSSKISGIGAGISALDHSQVTVSKSEISGPGDFGIVASGSSQVTVNQSNISGFGQSGIDAQGSSQVLVSQSSISNNNGEGISAYDSSWVKVVNSKVLHNQDEGIFVDSWVDDGKGKASSVEVYTSDISWNTLDGIRTINYGQVTVFRSKVSNNYYGITSSGYNPVNVIDSDIVNNNGVGIFIYGPGNVVVKGGNISDNNWWGVSVWTKACGFGDDSVGTDFNGANFDPAKVFQYDSTTTIKDNGKKPPQTSDARGKAGDICLKK